MKELDFNVAKARVHKVEALLAGHLLAEEITDDLIEGAEKHVLKLSKAQSELSN